MRSRLFIFIFLLLLVVDCGAAERSAVNFSLTNWDGKTVSMQDLKDKVVVLTFSYANCSSLCPIITARLSVLDEGLKRMKDIVYLHISVEPSADTPKKRKEYFKLYGLDAEKDGRWMFLSGQKKELLKLWDQYGIKPVKLRDRKLPGGYLMQYTPYVAVIDKKGIIRLETDFGFSEEEIKGLIQSLSGVPSIVFSETRFEAGKVKEGEVIKRDFEFVNTGSEVLKIVDLVPA